MCQGTQNGNNIVLAVHIEDFTSTSEDEYIAVSLYDQEVVYIRDILRDFGVTQTQPTLIYEDNFACITMSVNPVHRQYSRHIDIR